MSKEKSTTLLDRLKETSESRNNDSFDGAKNTTPEVDAPASKSVSLLNRLRDTGVAPEKTTPVSASAGRAVFNSKAPIQKDDKASVLPTNVFASQNQIKPRSAGIFTPSTTGRNINNREKFDSEVRKNYYIQSNLEKEPNWSRYLELAQKDTLTDEEKAEAKEGEKYLRDKANEYLHNDDILGAFKLRKESEQNIALGQNYQALAAFLNYKYSASAAAGAGLFKGLIPFAEKLTTAASKATANAADEYLDYTPEIQQLFNNYGENKQILETEKDVNKVAGDIGSGAGGLLSLIGASGITKGATGLIKGFSKLAPWVQNVINSGLTFGSVSGLQAAGEVPTKKEWDENEQLKAQIASAQGQSYTPQEYSAWDQVGNVLKSAGISAAGGAAGSFAGSLVGNLGAKVLTKYGMQTPFAEFVRQTLAGTAFGAADVGVTYAMYTDDYKPSKEQVIKDVAVAFLFSALTSSISTAEMTSANKAYIEYATQEMQAEYQRTFSNTMTAVERQAAYNSVLNYNNACRQALAQNYFAGQQTYVNQIGEILNAVDEQIGLIKQTTNFGNSTMINGEVNITGQTGEIVSLPEITPEVGTAQNTEVVPRVNIPAAQTPAHNAIQSVAQPQTEPEPTQPVPAPETNNKPAETPAVVKGAIEEAAATLGDKGAKAFKTVIAGNENDVLNIFPEFSKLYNLGKKSDQNENLTGSALESRLPETPHLNTAQRFAAYISGRNDAKPVENKVSQTAPKAEAIQAENEKPYTATLYHGSGKTVSEIYNGIEFPVAGQGKYYATSEKAARNYGDNIETAEVHIDNPIVVKDDADWRKLTSAAGWEYSNMHSAGEEASIKASDDLRKYILSSGHDGLVIQYEKNHEGDINIRTGKTVKTLDRVFGHDQVVVYDRNSEKTVENSGLKINENENTIKSEIGQIDENPAGKIIALVDGGSSSQNLANTLAEKIKSGTAFNSAVLFETADAAFGGTMAQGKYTPKDAYDALELAVNQHLVDYTKNFNGDVKTAVSAVKSLQKVLDLIPTQTKRTDEQMSFQQFSTPPNIAFLSAWAANITGKDVVLEPSAGIGGLAVFPKAWGAKVYVNELSERRLAVLENMGFDGVYNVNAEQLNNLLPDDLKPSVVLMNPPFSSTAGRTSTNKTSNAIRHVEQALLRLNDNGRLVAILGKGMSNDSPSFKAWWNDLRKKYDIRANLSIDGSNYKKYGTTFGNQIVIIDKTGPQKGETITGEYKDLTEIPKVLEGIRNDRIAVNEITTVGSGSSVSGADTQKPVTDSGSRSIERPNGSAAGNGRSNAIQSDSGRGTVERTGNRESVSGNGNVQNGQPVGQRSSVVSGTVPVEPEQLGSDRPVTEPALQGLAKQQRKKAKSDDGVYAEYVTNDLTIKGAKKHPAPLVESAAMAAVPSPKATYVPDLPRELITTGAISDAQLENIIYAGQAHEQLLPDGSRKGYFIGDGTGVGKGRQISGIILDNYRHGRKKALWISNNAPLFDDARRDWSDIGGSKDLVFSQSKTKLDGKIAENEGILFTTYDTLKTEKANNSRLQQIINWAGKDFDGVIAFDEAHNMSNLLGKKGSRGNQKPSAKAMAGMELQDALPNARIVYVSATAATDVRELAFAKRLGLWGRGTQFMNVDDFVSKISSGGLAAMELVARDMKSMGLYLARSISYDGVSYNTLQHDLTPMQTQIYNTMCQAWQVTLSNIDSALNVTGAINNANARSSALSAYYGAMQRFYNQVLTSMSMPSVVKDIKKELAKGHSCILQIVNTNQAESDRQIAKAKETGAALEELDLTPKGTLIGYLENSFPIYAYEEVEDDEGNLRAELVVDKDGNPVIDKEAVAMRDELIARVNEMSVPEGPLEMLFDAFGADQVAEITGRTRRVVPKMDANGETKLTEESRTANHVAADVQAFQDGKKRILVFSDAGGTGKSYHADKRAQNQQQRIHYLLQAGWSASKATQGFGRSHRSNQVTIPQFKLITTNIMGQKRFISTIARRLDQLGALTKGQRETGSGMFGAKDNLESDLAKDSLRNFYDNLGHNRVEGVDGMDILKKLGLNKKFVDEYGSFKLNEDLARDMNTFLNRILALEVEEQNIVFGEFNRIFETNFEKAMESGTLDLGLENVKADKIEILDDKVIRTDENTGATTNYVQAKTFKKPTLLTTIAELESFRSDYRGIYRTDKGEIRAVYRIADKTDAYGRISKMYRLQSAVATKSVTWSEDKLKKNAEAIDKAQWGVKWETEVAKAPEYIDNTVHMLTGTLLPIWNRLPNDGNTRVMRIVADDGSQYLGRVIPPSQIDDVLKSMGVGGRTKETYDPADLAKRILQDGAKVVLTENRIVINRRRVSGEYRMEITGNNLWYIAQQYKGIITETINYDRRYFIPTGENGESILAEIIKDNPVSNVSTESPEDADSLIKSDLNSQTVGSGDTSINKEKLPAVFSKVEWNPGTINLDLGGGKFDNAAEYLKPLGVTNYVYDKYNRSPEHNASVAELTQEGKSDTVTVSNVLNVIKEQSGRDEVLQNALDAVKPDGAVYITVYEGDGKGGGKYSQYEKVEDESGASKKIPKSWQENRLTSEYLPEVRKYFGDVSIKSKVIIAKAPKKTLLKPAESVDRMAASESATDKWNAKRVGSTEKAPMPISDIINKVRYDFGIPITTGHIRGGKTLGEYRRSSQGIRTKIANDLPTVAHELGHHLDNKYSLVAGMDKTIASEIIGALSGEMKSLYPEKKWKTEALAEFVRKYLQNRETAAIDYPNFTEYFTSSMRDADKELVAQLADEVNAYYALDADTASSAIRLGEENGKDFRTIDEKIRDKSDELYQAWIDSNRGIKLFDRATGADTYKLASNSAYADAVAGAILTGDLTDINGQRVSDGLIAALSGIDTKNRAEYRDFGEYLVVKHGPERLNEGMRIFADDRKNSTKWMNFRQSELEHKYPKFKETSEKLYEFQKSFLQTWGVNTGLVLSDSAAQWAERWKYYVPLNRAVGDKGRTGARRGFANQNSTIKKAHGSGLDIVHPVDNIVNNIVRMVNAGMRNNVMVAITKEAQKNEGMALFLEKVPAPIKVNAFDARELKDKLSNQILGSSLSGDNETTAFDIISGIDDILIQYGRGKAYGDVITVLRGGDQEFWKINDPMLLSSVTNMNVKRMPAWLETYGEMSRFITSNLTGNNVLWSIFSNFPRDIMTMFTFSKDKNPLHILGGIGSAYVNKIKGDKADPLYKEYLAMGGGKTSAYTADRSLARNIRKKVTGDKLSWLNPMEWLEFVADAVELGPRYSYYKIMRNKGYTPTEAFYESTDITVNFRRGGINGRTLNKVVPFFNAGVQGLDKFARWITAEEAPVGSRAKAVRGRAIAFFLTSVALAAITFALNGLSDESKKNYTQLSNYTKNSYWCIPVGNGKFFTIPKPREIAVLTSFMETCVEQFAMGNEHAFDGFYEYVTQQALPNVVSDIAQGDIYGAIGSLGIIGVGAYMMANRDFLGNPIVSSGLQSLEPKDQYTSRTSKIAKWLGQAFNTSPQMVDFFFQQTLGGWWKTQKALFPVGGENTDFTLGIQGQYVKDNQYSTDLVNWLYDALEKSQAKKNSNPEDAGAAIAYKWDSLMTTFYSRYYKLAKGEADTTDKRATRQTVLNMIAEYRKNIDSGSKTSTQEAIEDVCNRIGSTENMPAVMPSAIKDDAENAYTLTDSQYVEYQTEYLTAYYDYVEGTLPLCQDVKSKDAALKAAKEMAKNDATSRALNRLGVGAKAYTEKQEAEAAGLDATEQILFEVAYDALSEKHEAEVKTKKEENPSYKAKSGELQKQIIEMLDDMDLSDEEKSYLFSTKYTSDKNNPFD